MSRQAVHFIFALVVLFAVGCADRSQEQTTTMEEETTMEQEATPEQAPVTYSATLTGAAEVPGPGDTDGSGMASVTLDQDEVCFEITVSDIEEATAAHIHAGAAGESGGPVVNFDVPTNGLSGCVSGVEDAVLAQIRENPSAYYVNVHNAEFGAGAVRGQLTETGM